MNWNIKNIETAIRMRVKTSSTAMTILGNDDMHIRPEGTGKELFNALNLNIDDKSDQYLSGYHDLTVYLYLDTMDGANGKGESGYNQALDLAAELHVILDHNNQDSNSAPLLDLSAYGYRAQEQRIDFNPGPISTGGNPATFRVPMRLSMVVLDLNIYS